MSDDAEYHRTFIRIGDYHPPTKRQTGFRDSNTRIHVNLWEVFAVQPAFNAYRKVANGLIPVRLMPKAGQNFDGYATEWEDTYSTLTANWRQRVEPYVDDKLKVVGHIGRWRWDEIFIPVSVPVGLDWDLQQMVDKGVPAFASATNPLPSDYKPFHTENPTITFRLLTKPDGAVDTVLGWRSAAGAEATISPFDVISIGRAAIAVVGTGRRYIVGMVMRKGSQRAAAVGPTKELAEKAASAAKAPTIPVQTRKVSRADMMKWEQEGGHALQKHGPQHTRETLKKRVQGREEIPAPQMQAGGVKGTDYRVWQGERDLAASKWASEEDMHRAIAKVIDDNLEAIRRVTNGGGEVVLSKQAVGFKTGEGWITAGKEGATRGVFYDTNLKGVTVVIRRRANRAARGQEGKGQEGKGQEGWYVHTAYPDRAL